MLTYLIYKLGSLNNISSLTITIPVFRTFKTRTVSVYFQLSHLILAPSSGSYSYKALCKHNIVFLDRRIQNIPPIHKIYYLNHPTLDSIAIDLQKKNLAQTSLAKINQDISSRPTDIRRTSDNPQREYTICSKYITS